MFDEQLLLDNALEAWMRHHRMTYSLLGKLKDEQLYAEVLKPDLTSFARHFEEIASVQEAYAAAFLSGKLDFSDLPRDSEYKGNKSKSELKMALEVADQMVLENVKACPADRAIDIFGNRCSRIDLVHTLLHHELFHHGMFSVFSYDLKFNLPQDWNDFWWTAAPFDN
jgi:hypothetical protein